MIGLESRKQTTEQYVDMKCYKVKNKHDSDTDTTSQHVIQVDTEKTTNKQQE